MSSGLALLAAALMVVTSLAQGAPSGNADIEKHAKLSKEAVHGGESRSGSRGKGKPPQLSTNLLQSESQSSNNIAANMKGGSSGKRSGGSTDKGKDASGTGKGTSAQLSTNLLQSESQTSNNITKNMKP